MFSRWCQENFFAYTMHHFAIDLLAEYSTEDLPADEKVVNPAWRTLNKKRYQAIPELVAKESIFTGNNPKPPPPLPVRTGTINGYLEKHAAD